MKLLKPFSPQNGFPTDRRFKICTNCFLFFVFLFLFEYINEPYVFQKRKHSFQFSEIHTSLQSRFMGGFEESLYKWPWIYDMSQDNRVVMKFVYFLARSGNQCLYPVTCLQFMYKNNFKGFKLSFNPKPQQNCHSGNPYSEFAYILGNTRISY